MQISIHALVKRATMFMRKTDADIKISIHALVKRATIYFVQSIYGVNLFQSTPS